MLKWRISFREIYHVWVFCTAAISKSLSKISNQLYLLYGFSPFRFIYGAILLIIFSEFSDSKKIELKSQCLNPDDIIQIILHLNLKHSAHYKTYIYFWVFFCCQKNHSKNCLLSRYEEIWMQADIAPGHLLQIFIKNKP